MPEGRRSDTEPQRAAPHSSESEPSASPHWTEPDPRGNVDLHIHTTASDGSETPRELFEMAREKGLAAILY